MVSVMRSTAALALAAAALSLWASIAFGGGGSNQGSYGTNFAPATLSGTVTSNGAPASGAAVSTTAGHSATADAAGAYTLNLDAPGIYQVTAQSGANSQTQSAEVTLGATTTLNFAFGAAATPTPPPPPTPTPLGGTVPPPPTPTPIPGVSEIGLGILAALLAALLLWQLGRRRKQEGL